MWKFECYVDTWEWALPLCFEKLDDYASDYHEIGLAIKVFCFDIEIYKQIKIEV